MRLRDLPVAQVPPLPSPSSLQPVWQRRPSRHHVAMNLNRSQANNDNVELLPLKSALVNNNYNNNGEQFEDGTTYYPSSSFNNPNANHPSSASFFDYTLLSKRTPASKRLLARTPPPPPPPSGPLVTLSGAPPPSRRREELAALANLRKKVAPQLLVSKRNVSRASPAPEPAEGQGEGEGAAKGDAEGKLKQEQLDNRPKLLQRVLTARPVSMVVQWSEVRTAWQDSDFITDSLCWHNVYRQRHGAPVLLMAAELCDYAQAWANHLAHTNKFYYRNDRDVGQNLFQKPVTSLQSDVTGQEVSSYWYAAVRQYSYFKEPDVLHANVNAGHFTQMVWVATRFFGVGKARSRAGKVIVVANYSPPGNISGQFETNVLPPLPDNFPDAASASASASSH